MVFFSVRKQLNLSQISFLIHSCYKSKKKRIKFQLTFLALSIKREWLERWRELSNLKFKCLALVSSPECSWGCCGAPAEPLCSQVAQLGDDSRNGTKNRTCKYVNVEQFLVPYKLCFPKWEGVRIETIQSVRCDNGMHLFIWRLMEFPRPSFWRVFFFPFLLFFF